MPWLLGVICFCTYFSLQLMTVFDVRTDLEKLPAVTLKTPKHIELINPSDDFEDSAQTTESNEANEKGAGDKRDAGKKDSTDDMVETVIPATQLVRNAASYAIKSRELYETILNSSKEWSQVASNQSNVQELLEKTRKALDNEKATNGPDVAKYEKRVAQLAYNEKENMYKLQLSDFNRRRAYQMKEEGDYIQQQLGAAVNFYMQGLKFSEWLSPPAAFVAMPNMMLTLMVSLLMGALGSSIRMMVELLQTKETEDPRWYFFQPFLGALLAFAVFILFKSAHNALSGGGSAGAELNPYMIAFVGIVSGMLSEKAYRRIGVEGSRLLAEDTMPRYVRPDVAAAQLATLRKSPADLQRFFARDVPVEMWLTGQEKLAPNDQTIVAAWLNAPEWQVLTDKPPQPPFPALPKFPEETGESPRYGNEDTEFREDDTSGDAARTSNDVEAKKTALVSQIQEKADVAQTLSETLQGDAGQQVRSQAEALRSQADAARNVSAAAPGATQQLAQIQATATQSDPIVVTVANAITRFTPLIGTIFPPAALITSLIGIGAKLAGDQYARWYARVLDKPYVAHLLPPSALDGNAAIDLVLNSKLWKDKLGQLITTDRARVNAIVRGAVSEDGGEALWNDTEVQALFNGDRKAFEAATRELHKLALDNALLQEIQPADIPPEVPGGKIKSVFNALDAIRQDGSARALLDQVMLAADTLKQHGKLSEKDFAQAVKVSEAGKQAIAFSSTGTGEVRS